MRSDELIAYCLGRPGSEETCPRGDGELVDASYDAAVAALSKSGQRPVDPR